jgi:hypothetical protein
MTWLDLVSGDAQLHRDLVRSLVHPNPPHSSPRPVRPRGHPRRRLKIV